MVRFEGVDVVLKTGAATMRYIINRGHPKFNSLWPGAEPNPYRLRRWDRHHQFLGNPLAIFPNIREEQETSLTLSLMIK